MISEFGVGVLPDEMKTPALMNVLYAERNKVHAHEEYRERLSKSPLKGKKLYDLVLAVTGSKDHASKAQSYYELEESKRERK